VDAFLPPYEPRQVLDPADPVSIGAMVGPEAFEEVRYLAHLRQLDALERIPSLAEAFAEAVGRPSGGLLHAYRTADAETIVVALGSVLGTIKDAVDARREAGERIGVVGITAFRPFPVMRAGRSLGCPARRGRREGLQHRLRRCAFDRRRDGDPRGPGSLRTVIAGLGGRPITRRSLEVMLVAAGQDQLPPLTFLDLDHAIVERERGRMTRTRRSGPSAENILATSDRRVADWLRSPYDDTSGALLYQVGSFAAGNRLLDDDQRSVQADPNRSNSLDSGHRACQGCGEALGARYALDAAMRATHGQLVAVNATGCLEVFSTPYPETSWRIPWLHSSSATRRPLPLGWRLR